MKGITVMNKFEAGQIYSVRKWSDFGETTCGTCEIISIDLKPENEVVYQSTSVKEWYEADVGMITYILHTASNNTKTKNAKLKGIQVSDSLAIELGIPKKYQSFSPTARNYRPVSAYKDLIPTLRAVKNREKQSCER
jgi:hypothetical protein